ncbi:MAG: flagellar hook-length control protein FliK [Immundisolibacter sp.]
MAARPGSPGFAGELGNRLIWLVNQGVQEARLQLNPRELGPIEVRLGFSDGAAQVSFNVQHAGTAAAVQQSLPQLRELLAQQGLQLGQAAVFQQNAGNADQTEQQASRQGWTGGGGVAHGLGGEDLPPVTAAYVIGRGLIDAYA